MPKPNLNGTNLNVCTDSEICNQLAQVCSNDGQSKAFAIERALSEYLIKYKKNREILKNLEVTNGN